MVTEKLKRLAMLNYCLRERIKLFLESLNLWRFLFWVSSEVFLFVCLCVCVFLFVLFFEYIKDFFFLYPVSNLRGKCVFKS